MKNVIYGLVDPRDNQLRYVGKATVANRRFNEHLKGAKQNKFTYKDNWIRCLLKLNLKPELIIIDNSLSENLDELEKHYIAYFKFLGCKLTNLTNGGEGTSGYRFTEEQVSKMRQKALARDWTNFVPFNKKPHMIIDGIETRNCAKCSNNHSLDQFHFNKNQNKYHSYCKFCRAQSTKIYREKNPTKYKKLSPEEYKISRLVATKKGGLNSKKPEVRAQISSQRSKAIEANHIINNTTLQFSSALEAKKVGFQNSNIGQAIKYNKPYKGYMWKFV